MAGALDRVDYWPSATHWAGLLLWRTEPHREVVITGGDVEAVQEALKELRKAYRPQILWAGGTHETLPLLKGKVNDALLVFICQNNACELPHSEINAADEALNDFRNN